MRTDQRGAVVVRREDPRPAPSWEYKQRTMEIDADLTQWGDDGWECYAIIALPHDPISAVYHFKRRRRP